MVTAVPTQKGRLPTTQKRSSSKEQLRRDRMTFALVLLFVAGLIGLLIWLAAVSPPADYNAFNYWMY